MISWKHLSLFWGPLIISIKVGTPGKKKKCSYIFLCLIHDSYWRILARYSEQSEFLTFFPQHSTTPH